MLSIKYACVLNACLLDGHKMKQGCSNGDLTCTIQFCSIYSILRCSRIMARSICRNRISNNTAQKHAIQSTLSVLTIFKLILSICTWYVSFLLCHDCSCAFSNALETSLSCQLPPPPLAVDSRHTAISALKTNLPYKSPLNPPFILNLISLAFDIFTLAKD